MHQRYLVVIYAIHILVLSRGASSIPLRPFPQWLLKKPESGSLIPCRYASLDPATEALIYEIGRPPCRASLKPVVPSDKDDYPTWEPGALHQICPPSTDRLLCFDGYMSLLLRSSDIKRQDETFTRQNEISANDPIASKNKRSDTVDEFKRLFPWNVCKENRRECFNWYVRMWLEKASNQKQLLPLPGKRTPDGTFCLPGETSIVCVERLLMEEQSPIQMEEIQSGKAEKTSLYDIMKRGLSCAENPDQAHCIDKQLITDTDRRSRDIDICKNFNSNLECFENYLNLYAEIYTTQARQHLGKKHFVGRDTSAALKLLEQQKADKNGGTKTMTTGDNKVKL